MLPMTLTVDLSRIQFAATAGFHFLFVPLTLGLSWMLVVFEACYLKTGKQVYKDMTRFWGKLFAINFAMGVITGLTMEFEFGLNWAYFSRFIGDTFGAPLAIEGVVAFMTEATMFGLFFFTWDKVKKPVHFLITFVMAFGTNMSIVMIIVANSWMQHPVGTSLNVSTMTMHLTSFVHLFGQSLAQIRIGHIVFAGLLTGATFVLGISAYYLLKGRDVAFAKRSIAAAAGVGLCASVFVFFLGDANGVAVAKTEPMKMAAMEGQWTTQKAPAAWYPIAFPDQSKQKNDGVFLKIPGFLSLIATHSLAGQVEGIKELEQANRIKIENGLQAYNAMIRIREGKAQPNDQAIFNQYRNVIGYAWLLKRYNPSMTNITQSNISKAVKDTVPEVWLVFWTFRIMLVAWGLMFLIFLFTFIQTLRRKVQNNRWLLRAALYGIPLPWIAVEGGWFVAEIGRQPWVLHGVMPTYFGISSLHWGDVLGSLIGFVGVYGIMFIVELFLMFKFARKGPSTLGEGRYHYETITK